MVLKILLLLVLLPALVLGQGKVDVSILGTKPIDEIWVTDPNGRPLTGTNLVAQIVYGPNAMSLTNQLGGTHALPGAGDTVSWDVESSTRYLDSNSKWVHHGANGVDTGVDLGFVGHPIPARSTVE
jgi:hypothetical protein